MNASLKTVFFWFFICVSALLLWQSVRSTPQDRRSPEISYSQFISEVQGGNIASVVITGSQIQGEYRNTKGAFRLAGPNNQGVYLDALQNKGVEIRFKDVATDSLPLQLLSTWAPLILLGALWFFMIRQMQRRRTTLSGGTPSGTGPLGPSS